MPGSGSGPGEDTGGGGGGGGITSLTLEIPTGAVDGMNDTFVFTNPPVMVFYQSVLQNNSGVDYTLVGSTATFVIAPLSGLVQGLVAS